MQETVGFQPQLFILHYSSFIIHYWVYRTDKPKFETLTKALPRNPRNRPPSDKEIGTNCKSPPALRQNNRQIPLFFQFLTKI